MIGVPEKGRALASELRDGLRAVEGAAAFFPRRPRVYFEEWHDPLISGIRWVSELIEIAGGDDVFAELRPARLARERTVEPEVVLQRNPEVMLASWCGRKFRPDYLEKRPGWPDAPFMTAGRVYEIDSSTILQPGPGALTDGVREMHRLLARTVGAEPAGADG
jgi:iron complex transport system substrate-binding protein